MKLRPVLSVAAAAVLSVTAFAQLAADAGDLRARAERGDARAQLALGKSLVANQPVEAFAWLSLAVERGESSEDHARLFRELTPAQFSAAEKLAAEFRTRQGDGSATVVPAATAAANEIAELKAQNEKLSRSAEESRALAEGAAVARARLATVEKELTAARAELAVRETRAGETSTQLRRDLDAAMQQRDQIADQLSQLRRDKASAEMDRDTVRAELAALRAQPAPAAATEAAPAPAPAAPGADTAELERALKEAQMKVDMTVRAFAIKDEESQRAQLKSDQAATAQLAAERVRDEAVANAQRLEGELAAAKQAEAAALAAKGALQNELYAAQVRIENYSRAFARQGGTGTVYVAPTPPPTALSSPGATTVAEAEKPAPATATPAADAGAGATPASAGPRTHKVADGETLSLLSFKYYGSPNKWDKIFAANRSKLKSADYVKPGTVLVIP